MKKWIWGPLAWIFALVALLLITSLAISSLFYANFDTNYRFLLLKKQAIATGWYLPFYYSHVLVAAFILLIGTFQINTRWSMRPVLLHRLLGQCYAYGIIFLAAPGALGMSFFIDRGPVVMASFLLQTVLWVACTLIAVQKIKAGLPQQHHIWMVRSYSITLAAVTLRLYTFLFSGSVDLTQQSAYEVIAWSSWLLNMIVAEIYIQVKLARVGT